MNAVESRLDRAFGYQIGDLVTQSLRLSGAASQFDPAVLPRPGIVNAWLARRDVDPGRAGDPRVIRITYQITAASDGVALMFLPAIELQRDGRQLARIDATPLSVSPIIGSRPIQRDGLGDLRDDRRAAGPDPEALRQRLGVFTSAAALCGLWLLWQRRQRARSANPAPFNEARRDLKILARTRGASRPDAGYRILHRAFDASAGRSVFLEDIPGYLSEHPLFAKATHEIEAFYENSRAHFFAEPHEQLELTHLIALASHLAQLERRA